MSKISVNVKRLILAHVSEKFQDILMVMQGSNRDSHQWELCGNSWSHGRGQQVEEAGHNQGLRFIPPGLLSKIKP